MQDKYPQESVYKKFVAVNAVSMFVYPHDLVKLNDIILLCKWSLGSYVHIYKALYIYIYICNSTDPVNLMHVLKTGKSGLQRLIYVSQSDGI